MLMRNLAYSIAIQLILIKNVLSMFATGSLDGQIKFWNEASISNESLLTIDNGSPIATLENSLNSPEILISGSTNGSINIWNLMIGRLENSIVAHTSSVLVLKLSKYTFNELASGSSDNKLKIWNLNETASKLILQINETNRVYCIEYLSKTIIAYCANNLVNIYDLALKSLINSHSILSSLVGVYLIDNNLLVTGSNSAGWNTIIFNISNTTNFTKYNDLKLCINSADRFTSETTELLFVGCGTSLRKWIINTQTTQLYPETNFITVKILDYPFAVFSSLSLNNSIQIFDYTSSMANGPISKIINSHSNKISSIQYISKYISLFSYTKTSLKSDYPTSIQDSTAISTLKDNLITTKSIETTITNIQITTNKDIYSTKTLYSNITLSLSDIFVNFENLTDLIQILQNKSFIFDLKSTSSLPIDLLSSTKYDISDCISNCSNQGSCKIFNEFKFICNCFPNYSGSKCQTDLRPCSYNPCLNYLKCEDIYLNSSIDFKCECKNGFYGKRCENKINLCQNETCSGNGICQVIRNELFQNESIECKCFGIGQYEGNKCEIITTEAIIRQTTIKTTYIIAIIILISFYLLFILSDLFDFFIIRGKQKTKRVRKH